MSVRNFLTLTATGAIQRIAAIIGSAGVADAFKIVATDATGRLDPTLMPVGIGADTLVVQASEALAAGDFVSIHDVTGAARVRRASAADTTRPAVGFVLNNVASGSSATVFFEGSNTALSGLTIGAAYILSPTTPGAAVPSTTTLAAGQVYQPLGHATGATAIATEIQPPISIVN